MINIENTTITQSYFINNNGTGAVIRAINSLNSKFEAIFIHNTGNAVILANTMNSTNITNSIFSNNNIESTINVNTSNNVFVNNNVFINNVTNYEIMADSGLNADYNWFGNNASNYKTQPKIKSDVNYDTWLFLNGSAKTDNISVFDSTKIIFKLYNYNSTSNNISENDLMDFVELIITATNGNINTTTAFSGESIEYTSTNAGIGSITAIIGDAKYTININAKKLPSQIIADSIITVFNANDELVITLVDIKGNAISGAEITVDLNGAKNYFTDDKGQVKVSTKGLVPKTYLVNIIFNGNTNYEPSTKDIEVTIEKATPKLIAKNKKFKTKTKTKKYSVVLKDNTGKAIKKAKVTLKIKGKKYKAKTNSKGKATFKITKLNKKGTYKAVIKYRGDKYYNKAGKKAKIKVIVTFKTVSKGSKDKSTVKEIQQALKDNGYYQTYKNHYLKVDGKFKSCTVRSVKEFQHDKGLKVTGSVDKKTATKLGII